LNHIDALRYSWEAENSFVTCLENRSSSSSDGPPTDSCVELRRRTVRRGLLHVRVHVDLGRAHVGGEKANVVAAQDRKRTRIFMEMPRNTPYRSDVESNVEMWCQRRRQAVSAVADAMAQSTVCTARRRAFSPPRGPGDTTPQRWDGLSVQIRTLGSEGACRDCRDGRLFKKDATQQQVPMR